jgi:hypothetical protein
MKHEFEPIEYHLEVYEHSFRNDATFFVQSSTPFGSMSIGDYFNSAATDQWQNPPVGLERFVIKEIEHIIWHIDGSHTGHKIMLALDKVSE